MEQAFKAVGRTFEMDGDPGWGIISGPLSEATVLAIHQNQRVLLKIHGDCADPTFRVFTVEEYERNYGGQTSKSDSKGAGGVNVGTLAWINFTNRPLLFLGCSLDKDRTVTVLKEIHNRLPTLTHYAVMEAYYSLPRWEARVKELDQMGIRRPLWFAPGSFGEIESILRELLERISTRQVRSPQHAPVVPPETTVEAIERFQAAVHSSSGGGDAPPENTTLTNDDLNVSINLIKDKLLEKKLIFFLGAAANLLSKSPGDAFYEWLTKKFDCPPLLGGRGAVAAYIVSQHGSIELWRAVKEFVSNQTQGIVHKFLAALPGFLRATKRSSALPLWILTTNYDTLVEQALDEVSEPFYRLYYLGGINSKGEGQFALRNPDGSLQVIEKPGNMRWLRQLDAHVVVKLNGGVVYGGGVLESVVIAPGHYERAAALMPNALPEFLRKALLDRFLLFLGHGLAEPDVQELAKLSIQGATEIQRISKMHWFSPRSVT